MRQGPRILLIGINGTYNYGCEAIIRGTELLVRERWPNAELVYATPRPDDDERRLDGAKISVTRLVVLPKYHPSRVAHKLLSRSTVGWGPSVYPLSLLRGTDIVLSVGGDIYTALPDGSCPGHMRSLVGFANAALRRKVKYVLWGASVGPFDVNPNMEQAVCQHLRRVDSITVRESLTLEYLERRGVRENTVACADPAFAVAPEIQRENRGSGPVRIAVNLSPLAVRYAGIDTQDAIIRQSKVVTEMTERLECRVLLVPHVICDFNVGADDRRYLAAIRDALPPSVRRQVELLDGDPGFVATKKELAQSDLLVAARMHCAVSGMSAGVPTMLLSYSRKARGMCRYVYGSERWVLPVEEFGEPGFWEMLTQLAATKDDMAASLATRMSTMSDDLRCGADSLPWMDEATRRVA